MDLEELEIQYQDAMDDVLNDMQTVVLLLAQVEAKTAKIGNSIQDIRSLMDTFIASQKGQTSLSAVELPLDEKRVALNASERELREVLAKLRG